MKYHHLWGSLHDNPHHNQMQELNTWLDHMRVVYDFWGIAYYPYDMVDNGAGFKMEGMLDRELIAADWTLIQKLAERAATLGFPFYAGYEWQGIGLDGDHNVFQKEIGGPLLLPARYEELEREFQGIEAIAIPHHLAYVLGNRGKNWDTHNETFSPFAEVYSSHGSSETDRTELSMLRHIHMGPRVQNTSYVEGLERGYHVGAIVSGDNHNDPAPYLNGSLCVLSEDRSPASIWEGLKAARVYGVNVGRIRVDVNVDGKTLSEVVPKQEKTPFTINVEGDAPIHRIEMLADNVLEQVYVHAGRWEKESIGEEAQITLKFRTEFGWGPDTRIFGDTRKEWDIEIASEATIDAVLPEWNSTGQTIVEEEAHRVVARLISRQKMPKNKWMGNERLMNEGLGLQVTGRLNDVVTFVVNGRKTEHTIAALLRSSFVEAEMEEVEALIQSNFGAVHSKRSDTWWHNAYKWKIYQAAPERAYTCIWSGEVDTREISHLRFKVYQENGAIAWLSPIYTE